MALHYRQCLHLHPLEWKWFVYPRLLGSVRCIWIINNTPGASTTLCQVTWHGITCRSFGINPKNVLQTFVYQPHLCHCNMNTFIEFAGFVLTSKPKWVLETFLLTGPRRHHNGRSAAASQSQTETSGEWPHLNCFYAMYLGTWYLAYNRGAPVFIKVHNQTSCCDSTKIVEFTVEHQLLESVPISNFNCLHYAVDTWVPVCAHPVEQFHSSPFLPQWLVHTFAFFYLTFVSVCV